MRRAQPIAMPSLTPVQWALAIAAATGIGLSKAGLAGVGLFHVVVFALLFGARDSTGIVLPMLLIADLAAVTAFHREARWDYIRRMLPPTCLGVVLGALSMRSLDDRVYKPVIGGIILALTLLQLVRLWRPTLFGDAPHTPWFVWMTGLTAGVTTMLANAAGPIIALYVVAVALPKLEVVGTMAWFFLIVNAFKVPFSVALDLIHGSTLLLNLALTPAIVAGVLGGGWIVRRLPQAVFDGLLLAFAGVAAIKLLLGG
jgi:uncharacterized protein